MGEPGSQYRELRECANHALLPKQAKKLVQALRHACEALRAAELKYGRISTATAQMHYAVGKICRDGRLFSPAIHHLGQASLIYYEVWCGYARCKTHPDVTTAVESLQEAIDNYQVRDPKCIDLPRELRDAIDPEASRCKCAQCDKVETDEIRFDRCSRCKVPSTARGSANVNISRSTSTLVKSASPWRRRSKRCAKKNQILLLTCPTGMLPNCSTRQNWRARLKEGARW